MSCQDWGLRRPAEYPDPWFAFPPPADRMALTSIVLGAGGAVLVWAEFVASLVLTSPTYPAWFTWLLLLPLAATIHATLFGTVALSRARHHPGGGGKTAAVAGLVLGIADVALLAALAFWTALLASFSHLGFNY